MRKGSVVTWVLLAGTLASATASGQVNRKKRNEQPALVVVQHVLISFGRKIPGKRIERTKKEAQALTEELLGRIKAGEDFDSLVKEYTNDSYPGIYRLTNTDAPLAPNTRKRTDMVPSFGDVAFNLEVGEVGVANYHGGNSPYGWHIIKRLE